MSELMGNIYGVYDAKPHGFAPGGMSLHNCMLPHGPDRDAFERASNAELKPQKRFAFDTETDALGAMNSKLVGMSFSWEHGTGHYVRVLGDRGASVMALPLRRIEP